MNKVYLTSIIFLTGCGCFKEPTVITKNVEIPVPVQPVQPPTFSLPHLYVADITAQDDFATVAKKYEATILQLKEEILARDKALDVYRKQPKETK